MKFLLVEPGLAPREIELDGSRESIKSIVGEPLEYFFPFDSEAAFICNGNSKIEAMPFNRVLRNEQGGIYDIVAGNLLICGLDIDKGENVDLSPQLVSKYTEMFFVPDDPSNVAEEIYRRLYGQYAPPTEFTSFSKNEMLLILEEDTSVPEEILQRFSQQIRTMSLDKEAADSLAGAHINIPDNFKVIRGGFGSSAFSKRDDIVGVTIPGNIIKIGPMAFSFCANLESVTINEGVEFIGSAAFWGCTKLVDITIPDSVIEISEMAFEGTAWFDKQPDGLVYAGKWVYDYKGDAPLEHSVTVREGTVGITDAAFSNMGGCKNLSIAIPNSVVYIGERQFTDCNDDWSGNITILCSEGFYAHEYAKNNQLKYKLLPK